MGIFDVFKGNKITNMKNESQSNEEKYGQAWLLIVSKNSRAKGLELMNELDKSGFVEATIALSMFTENQEQRQYLIKKAADIGNSEGLWKYCNYLPHSYSPNPHNQEDAIWESCCREAAEKGSVDAMNELGNVCNRRNEYAEAMYWYAMANANDHPQGSVGMIGISRKWVNNGASYIYKQTSGKFTKARFRCAIAYLELYADLELSVGLDELIQYCLDGEPIAGYLAGDLFEGIGNHEMAYKMYNALAFEKDAHALKCYADMHMAGLGTPKDLNTAMQMYGLAAEQGDRAAMFIMGEFNRNSNNRNMAAYWYGVSHARGYQYSLQRLVQMVQ